MNISKINQILNFILIIVAVYAVFTFVNQQSKLNSYNKDISYYEAQIEELKTICKCGQKATQNLRTINNVPI